ncbi:MAG: MucBP domain-containing protein [Bacilli bacterium]|nr:MucBP domain-containing protein [Bacilli bacterium]
MKKLIRNKNLWGILAVFLFAVCFIGGKKISFQNSPYNYKDYVKVEDGDESISGTNYVTFDAFFLRDEDDDGNAEGYRGATIQNKYSDKLYFELKVLGDVTLTNATISFDNSNVKVSGTLPKSSIFATTVYNEDYHDITLQNAGNGISSLFYLNVSPDVEKDLTKFIGTNKVILTGTVVDNITGESTNIRKEISYVVDSYSNYIKTNIQSIDDDGVLGSFIVTYTIDTYESYNQTPLYKSYLSGSISDLEGMHPKSVSVSANGSNVVTNYNASNQTFEAVKTAELEDLVITKTAYDTKKYDRRHTVWYVRVEYPYDSSIYQKEATIHAEAWHTGFKNKELETVDSTHVTINGRHMFTGLVPAEDGFLDDSESRIGEWSDAVNNWFVSKSGIIAKYDNVSNIPSWTYKFDQRYMISSVIDKDLGGKAVYTDTGLGEYTNYAKYKTVRVCFGDLYSRNGGEAVIKNYETGKTLFAINGSNNCKTLNFDEDIHRIIVETNELDPGTSVQMTVYLTREFELDKIATNFSKDSIERDGTIQGGFDAQQAYSDPNVIVGSLPIPRTSSAVFTVEESFADLEFDKSNYERNSHESSIPMTLYIEKNGGQTGYSSWSKGGYFLIEVPNEIIDIQDLDVPNASFFEELEISGKKFIRVYVEGNVPAKINVNMNAIIDPKSSTFTGTFHLYAKNLELTQYRDTNTDIYDVDIDGVLNEKVAYDTRAVRFIAPNEVITGTIIKNYDDKGSETISPLIANLNPLRGTNQADIELYVLNNSESNVKNLSIIGKVAYVGNTYQIGEGDLGTEFDTYMSGPIVVPAALQGDVTVLYSEKADPTSDQSDLSNGWTTSPSDYQNVKSYMIIFDGDYELEVGQEVDFSYPITTPETTENLNKYSYFTHGAYFDYITEAGLYSSEVSGGKLGVRLSRLYDAEFDLMKIYSDDVIVPGGVFILSDEDGNQRSVVFDSNGYARVNSLYVDTYYTLSQVSAYPGYSITTDKSFEMSNENEDVLYFSNYGFSDWDYGATRDLVRVRVDQEVLYKLDLNHFNSSTNEGIPNAIYKITGPNHENGTNVRTDANGHAYLDNLVVDKTYKAEVVLNEGYPEVKDFEFKVSRDASTHNLRLTSRQLPKITNYCSPTVNFSEYTWYSDHSEFYLNTTRTSGSSEMQQNCNYVLDLLNYENAYRVDFDSSLYDAWGDSSANSSLTWAISSNMNPMAAPYAIELNKDKAPTYSTTISQKASLTQAMGGGQEGEIMRDIVGGRQYNVFLQYHRSGTTSRPYFNTYIRIYPVNGKKELVATTAVSNLANDDNNKVIQSLENYDVSDIERPILDLDIPNIQIQKSVLNIKKVDATNNNPLAGAQFKISGPGFASPRYVTTDESGNASIELFQSFSGNYWNLGLDDDYPLTNIYTVQEVSAPKGYTIDPKEIKFTIDKEIDNSGDVSSSTIKYSTGNTFKETSYENGVYNAVMDDYPLFKVTKKDAETQNVLPNTYYVIYSIDDDGNKTPATDINNNYIGDKINIDGEDYYIVKTNENGEITLALKAGRYVLKEIQAADDKYDISDQETYFSIGEGKNYQAKGITFIKASEVFDGATRYNSGMRMLQTNDGGYLTSNLVDNVLSVTKYDSNFNVEWTKDIPCGYYENYMYTYHDDPERVYYTEPSFNSYTSDSSVDMLENDKGYYFAISPMQVVLVEKETGNTIYDTAASYPNSIKTYHYASTGFTPYSTDPTAWNSYENISQNYPYYVKEGDTENYYSFSGSLYVNYIMSYPVFDVGAKGVAGLSFLDGQYYRIYRSDGTVVPVGRTSDYIVYKFDNTGKLVDGYYILDKLEQGIIDYAAANNVELPSNFGLNGSSLHRDAINYLDDGSVAMLINVYTGGHSSRNNSMYFHAKFDKDGNLEFVTPMGVNGYSDESGTQRNGTNYARVYDDGSASLATYQKVKYTDSQSPNPLFNTADQQFTFPEEPGHDGEANSALSVLEHNASGKLVNVVELQDSNTNKLEKFDTTLDFYNVKHFKDLYFFSKTEDGGYIAALENDNFYNDLDREVILKSGEKFVLENTPSVIIYKVNSDSSVEWIKQYAYPYSNQTGFIYESNLSNDKFGILLDASTPTIRKIGEELPYNVLNTDRNSTMMIAEFKIDDEVIPETPSQVALELFNTRKVFEVTAESNGFGTFTISSGNNILYDGTDPGTVENVKYGDTTVNEVKVTPNAGYYISSITINDNKIDFSVDENGVAILDPIENVTENKHIYVTFKLGDSKVIVHHYLDGTTTRIAGDDILAGQIGSDYITEPKITGQYDLVKDDNGEYVIPSNYKGLFGQSNIEVTYYYIDQAQLRVNYYLENTDTPLSPSKTETKPRGSSYVTEPIFIALYELVSVDGIEDGILNVPLTEITYYYARGNKALVVTNYVDIESNEPLSDPTYDYYDYNEEYSTTPLDPTPTNYVLVSSQGNTYGIATEDITEVTYFYRIKKGIVTTKYIDIDNENNVVDPKVDEYSYGSTYTTSEPTNLPAYYVLTETPDNATGPVDRDNIVVEYRYRKPKGTVVVKYVDKDSYLDIADYVQQELYYGETYTSTPLAEIPEGYKLYMEPTNKSVLVEAESTTIIYVYAKEGTPEEEPTPSITPEVPIVPPKNDEISNPITLDDIMLYVGIFAVATLSIASVVVLRKRRK